MPYEKEIEENRRERRMWEAVIILAGVFCVAFIVLTVASTAEFAMTTRLTTLAGAVGASLGIMMRFAPNARAIGAERLRLLAAQARAVARLQRLAGR